MGVAAGDLDGDGRPDLAVTNFFDESTTLFHNLGGGQFADHTAAVGLAAPSRYRLGFGDRLPRRQQRRPARPDDGQRARERLPARGPLCHAGSAPDSAARGTVDRRLRAGRSALAASRTSAGAWPSATWTTTAASTPSWSPRTSRWSISTTGRRAAISLTIALEGTKSNRDGVGAG